MIELLLGVLVCVSIFKIADADDESGLLWGAVALLLCYVSLYIPLPYIRFLLAAVATVALMTVVKVIRDR